jgi:uncharacterized damage-inducible protein DinB
MTGEGTTLETFYKGWHDYQVLLIQALAPLTAEQLALRSAPHQWPVGTLAAHIVATRAGWFHYDIGEGSDETAPLTEWDETTVLTADELVQGLEATWRLMSDALARWSPEEMSRPFDVTPPDGITDTYTRQWIIWHLIEHDLHHGGEISLTLGMHGLQAPAL